MEKKKCLRTEFGDCPYRDEEIDLDHWCIRNDYSFEYAKERATIFCRSVPCNYALEMKENRSMDEVKRLAKAVRKDQGFLDALRDDSGSANIPHPSDETGSIVLGAMYYGYLLAKFGPMNWRDEIF